ncbi:MAG: hypothetical protein ACOYIQ_06485 [Christensenellales bacterium]|jgi:NRPS condensation-like uncharacterized protein
MEDSIKDKGKSRIKKWFRLDNSGTVYPLTMTHATQSLFRLGVQLKEVIDADALKCALEKVLDRFPTFKVEIRSGVFRHFLDENTEPPVVSQEHGELLKKINTRLTNGYPFRVTYYNKSIFIDFNHAICDGNGGMEFLKSLVFQYLWEKGIDVHNDGSVKDISSAFQTDEAEDSFLKYYRKFNFAQGIKTMRGKVVQGLKGKKFRKEGHGLIQGTLEVESVLKLAKQYGCSLTAFLASVYLLAVVRSGFNSGGKKDLAMLVPVDLRKFFPSHALNNFVIFTRCYLNPNTTPHTLEDFAKVIQKGLKDGLNKDDLHTKLSAVSILDKKVLIKALPLPFKVFMTKLGKFFGSAITMTSILSNLGPVNMPPSTHEHIEKFTFNLNCSSATPSNMAVVSFRDKLVISFTRQLISTEIERQFFTILSGLGLNVEVVSNLREIRE